MIRMTIASAISCALGSFVYELFIKSDKTTMYQSALVSFFLGAVIGFFAKLFIDYLLGGSI